MHVHGDNFLSASPKPSVNDTDGCVFEAVPLVKELNFTSLPAHTTAGRPCTCTDCPCYKRATTSGFQVEKGKSLGGKKETQDFEIQRTENVSVIRAGSISARGMLSHYAVFLSRLKRRRKTTFSHSSFHYPDTSFLFVVKFTETPFAKQRAA